MTPNDIITWLRDQAIRMPEEVHKRGMIRAASMLERLVNNLNTAVAQRNEYQEKYLDERERNAVLEAELKAEMHRHDRLQDFEVAEAEELRKLKEQSRWIPVTERLPKPGKRVLVCVGAVFEGFVNDEGVWERYYLASMSDVLGQPTHWMPLPEPPKEDA